MHVVPDQDPEGIQSNLEKYVEELTTLGVKIEVRRLGATRPVLCEADHSAAAALQEALRAPMVVSGLPETGSAPTLPTSGTAATITHRGIEMRIRFMYALPSGGRS
jgi:acetylornithine deacetylase/succinyl-diaminopimelate desuccinylase-like protein